MSDFELVGWILAFFVASAVIVGLLGGETDDPPETDNAPPEPMAQPIIQPSARESTASATTAPDASPASASTHQPQSTPQRSVESQLVDIKLQPPSSRTSPVAPTYLEPPSTPVAPSTAPQAGDQPAVIPASAVVASLPPSDATRHPAAPAQRPAQDASASDTFLISTARRGMRMVGASTDEIELIDFEPVPSRPQTPSIWSKNYPRPFSAHRATGGIEVLNISPGVRAERIPVRAETILVGKLARPSLVG